MAIKAILFSADQTPQVGVPALFGAAAVLLTLLWFWAQDERPFPGFPIVNRKKGEWFNTAAKDRMAKHSNRIMKEAYKKVSTTTTPRFCSSPSYYMSQQLHSAVWTPQPPRNSARNP